MVTSVAIAGLKAKFLYDPFQIHYPCLVPLLVEMAFVLVARSSPLRGPRQSLSTIPFSDNDCGSCGFINKIG